VGMLAKIRRMHFRDKMSLREVARRTGLSRNTVRNWLRQTEVTEPTYPARVVPSVVDPYREQLEAWLRSDLHRPKRDRRTVRVMFNEIRAIGYPGSYNRVAAFVKRWRENGGGQAKRQAYVPLKFAPGEAFQFDWSCEYATIAGMRRRLELAHVKLACSRAFWLVAYPTQSHEMLFDAHTQAFRAFGGVPRRGIYDNMKTAVDKVGKGKQRTINARFLSMSAHYLFEPDFCNRAAGWEKGIVEKNVQDRRRQLWQAAVRQSWSSLEVLNAWLARECRSAWTMMAHPEWPGLSIAEVLENEQAQLMPMPQGFDGYIEQPARVSATSLVSYQRNRYSVPSEHAHRIVSLRVYPDVLVVLGEGQVIARHPRSFERNQTFYDWQHYIPVLARKPGALRNGAPFAQMPESFQQLKRHLLRHSGGDRVMAQVLACVAEHGVEAVQGAVEVALASGRPSGEHVLNVLARQRSPGTTVTYEPVTTRLRLECEPRADIARYDELWQVLSREVNDVD
jgi:transposase